MAKRKQKKTIRKKVLIIGILIGLLCLMLGVIGWAMTAENAPDRLDDNVDSGDMLFYKPIIYLYPEARTDVSVELGYPENLTYTYPPYEGPWHMAAERDGNLIDIKTGRHYYALYWEGKNPFPPSQPKEGFIVKGKDVIAFLEVYLEKLGLNDREANEFIVYWLPVLESNAYNYIRFQTKEEQDKNMPLVVTPQPTTVIRVMMEYANLSEPLTIKEQELPPKPVREGFTVVEWGGTELHIKQ